MRYYKYFVCLFFVLFFSSCSSYKQIPYFLDLKDSTSIYSKGQKVGISGVNRSLSLNTGDALEVQIFLSDGKLLSIGNFSEENAISNIGKSSNFSSPSSHTNTIYEVSKEGSITIPTIGRFYVEGLSIDSVERLLYIAASKHLVEPTISIRMVNFTVTVLGEVNNPGKYIINKPEISILDALGLAGDMTVYGKRNNVIVVHKSKDGTSILTRINLNSIKSFESPSFYLKQDDIVYVEPSKGKAAANDASQIRTYAIISSVASLVLALIYNLRK